MAEPDTQPPPDTSTADAGARPFVQFLLETREGLLHSELSEGLATVVQSVSEHDKTGTLTLTLSIGPSKVKGAVEISDKVAFKPAEPDKDAALFFADGKGNLSRRDPRQPELPLRGV